MLEWTCFICVKIMYERVAAHLEQERYSFVYSFIIMTSTIFSCFVSQNRPRVKVCFARVELLSIKLKIPNKYMLYFLSILALISIVRNFVIFNISTLETKIVRATTTKNSTNSFIFRCYHTENSAIVGQWENEVQAGFCIEIHLSRSVYCVICAHVFVLAVKRTILLMQVRLKWLLLFFCFFLEAVFSFSLLPDFHLCVECFFLVCVFCILWNGSISFCFESFFFSLFNVKSHGMKWIHKMPKQLIIQTHSKRNWSHSIDDKIPSHCRCMNLREHEE